MKSPRKSPRTAPADELSAAFWDPSCCLHKEEFVVLRSLFKVDESDFVAPWRDATMLKVAGSTGKVEGFLF